MGLWDKIKAWLGVTNILIDVADDIIDTGKRQCADGEFCADPDCTHKHEHDKNTGCVNACFKNNKACDLVLKTRHSDR